MSDTINDGGLVTQDENEQKVYTFDYDAENLPAGVTLASFGTFIITPLDATGGAASLLLKDNEKLLTASEATIALERTVVGDGRATSVRLNGGVVGTKYQVVNRVTTAEVPAQIKEKRFFVRITG